MRKTSLWPSLINYGSYPPLQVFLLSWFFRLYSSHNESLPLNKHHLEYSFHVEYWQLLPNLFPQCLPQSHPYLCEAFSEVSVFFRLFVYNHLMGIILYNSCSCIFHMQNLWFRFVLPYTTWCNAFHTVSSHVQLPTWRCVFLWYFL